MRREQIKKGAENKIGKLMHCHQECQLAQGSILSLWENKTKTSSLQKVDKRNWTIISKSCKYIKEMQGIKNKDTTGNNSTKSVLGLLSSSAHEKMKLIS